MRIVDARPPNFDEIISLFPEARRHGVIFTYGDIVYAPGSSDIHPALKCHEAVHAQRQGQEIDVWWKRYLSDTEFRFNEELLAHRAEYGWFKGRDRNEAARALHIIAARLASPLYGSMVTAKKARQLIL